MEKILKVLGSLRELISVNKHQDEYRVNNDYEPKAIHELAPNAVGKLGRVKVSREILALTSCGNLPGK